MRNWIFRSPIFLSSSQSLPPRERDREKSKNHCFFIMTLFAYTSFLNLCYFNKKLTPYSCVYKLSSKIFVNFNSPLQSFRPYRNEAVLSTQNAILCNRRQRPSLGETMLSWIHICHIHFYVFRNLELSLLLTIIRTA